MLRRSIGELESLILIGFVRRQGSVEILVNSQILLSKKQTAAAHALIVRGEKLLSFGTLRDNCKVISYQLSVCRLPRTDNQLPRTNLKLYDLRFLLMKIGGDLRYEVCVNQRSIPRELHQKRFGVFRMRLEQHMDSQGLRWMNAVKTDIRLKTLDPRLKMNTSSCLMSWVLRLASSFNPSYLCSCVCCSS